MRQTSRWQCVAASPWIDFAATMFAIAAIVAGSQASAAGGEWKARSQLVWDGTEQALARKVFRVWDPTPHLDLDFVWESDVETSDATGVVNGRGRLVWLTKGAAAYDRAAIHSEYRGEMTNGRPDGAGILTFRSGRELEGTWKNGAMTGNGILRFENGDEYSGGFSAGEPDGLGRYAAVDGTLFEGRFVRGKRDGRGILITPDGSRWRSIWEDGEEIGRTPADAEAIELAQQSGLQVSVYTDRKKNRKFQSGGQDDGFPRFVYSAANVDGTVMIKPRSEALMDRWKGNATLGDNPEELFMDDIRQFSPVFIVVDVVNNSSKTKQIVGGHVRVRQSYTDHQPYLVALHGRDCGDLNLDTAYTLVNRGWGSADDVSVTYAFGEPAVSAEDVFVSGGGTIDDRAHFSIVEGLVGMGADVARLKAGFTCEDPGDLAACLADVRASGMLGMLSDRITETWGTVLAPVQGTVDYTWRDHEGQTQQRHSPISVDAPLLDLTGPECGAGGVVERDYPTVKLPLDKKDVRLPIQYRAQLKPRANKRVALGLVADKASRHLFDIVLETADGDTVVSPPIDLLYFLPRLPAYN